MEKHRSIAKIVASCLGVFVFGIMSLVFFMLIYVMRQNGMPTSMIATIMGVILLGWAVGGYLFYRKARREGTFRFDERKVRDPRLNEVVKLAHNERSHFKRVMVFCALAAVLFLGLSGGTAFYEYFKFQDGETVSAEVTSVRRTGSRKHRRYNVTLQASYDGETVTDTFRMSRSSYVRVGGVSVSSARLATGDEIDAVIVMTDEGYDMGLKDDVRNPWPEFAWGLVGGGLFALVAYHEFKILRRGEIRLGALPEKYRLARLAGKQ